ncbi:precorrin-6A synthase (deacetylating) [Paraconexibacter antarcticus]|uniref:Precorrin-6A synthase (Deacetylating) n=1 Tax=Paraconexibacter antarcticus TaxID=2949664 RepID=A0ABY5DSR1_9ACTN|nr:precorrin-6A synthase (deacetylating) [Paraconexibacter antarcticus]UTI64117.1 precorrin-6A synthase (deacetylating) [Paraconexibacter antarcticus]
MARHIVLVGIGAGDPGHVTQQAVRVLNAFDVLFVVTKAKGTDELVALRRQIVDVHRDPDRGYEAVELADPPRPWRTADDYQAAVARWREQRQELWAEAITGALQDGQTGAFLVWGDPSLYESTLAVVAEIAAAAPGGALTYEVIPGVSAVHALTARHRIPLNRVGRAVQIMPARLLAEGMPSTVDDVVVMLDQGATFGQIDPAGLDIYWGAFLGTPDELLLSGDLATVGPEIARVRAEAKARKGWMFDTYLLRRR